MQHETSIRIFACRPQTDSNIRFYSAELDSKECDDAPVRPLQLYEFAHSLNALLRSIEQVCVHR